MVSSTLIMAALRFPLCYSEALLKQLLMLLLSDRVSSCPPNTFCNIVKSQSLIYFLTFLNEDNRIMPCSLTVVPSLWSDILVGAAAYVVLVHIR